MVENVEMIIDTQVTEDQMQIDEESKNVLEVRTKP